MTHVRPVVLTISGHDPSGGAGIQADIEAIAALDCHPCSVITALTVQNTQNIFDIIPQREDLILRQLETIFDDIKIDAIKIGLMTDSQVVVTIGEFLSEHASIPVIVDPVLAASGGYQTSNRQLIEALIEHLIPHALIVTPNSLEARQLGGGDNQLDTCAATLLALGCEHVLITGTHETGNAVINTLYSRDSQPSAWSWARLPSEFHGSGCTLAASTAAYIALGADPATAISKAQDYTWRSLRKAYKISDDQSIPNRVWR